jgi:hypothetical protein
MPEQSARDESAAARQAQADMRWLREAIELSGLCPPSQTAFSVGAVLVSDAGDVIATGFSRELDPKDHAEEVALARAADDPRLAGATLYSSLEPCLSRASRPRRRSPARRRPRTRSRTAGSAGTARSPRAASAGRPAPAGRRPIRPWLTVLALVPSGIFGLSKPTLHETAVHSHGHHAANAEPSAARGKL